MSVLKVVEFSTARKRGLDSFSSPLYTHEDLFRHGVLSLIQDHPPSPNQEIPCQARDDGFWEQLEI